MIIIGKCFMDLEALSSFVKVLPLLKVTLKLSIYCVPCRKWHFPGSGFKNFGGGACPRTP